MSTDSTDLLANQQVLCLLVEVKKQVCVYATYSKHMITEPRI